ncbi:GPP34 family phosphoprotein [Streptomyces sp. NPDC020571]|uniref:GOLPH3/VPS74 family protein n=1 Tax=Streptomyces sp. NPDC020571 TaxID=3365079 RepID=UPI003795C100
MPAAWWLTSGVAASLDIPRLLVDCPCGVGRRSIAGHDVTKPLTQCLFLLNYDPAHKEIPTVRFRGLLMRAAALAELTLGRVLELNGAALGRGPGEPPADPFLVQVLSDVPAGKVHLPSLLQRNYREAEAVVRTQLLDAGDVVVVGGSRLGVRDVEAVERLRREVRDAVERDGDPVSLSPEVLLMAVLSAEAEVDPLFPLGDRVRYRKRLGHLASELDNEMPGFRKALRTSVATLRGINSGW